MHMPNIFVMFGTVWIRKELFAPRFDGEREDPEERREQCCPNEVHSGFQFCRNIAEKGKIAKRVGMPNMLLEFDAQKKAD